jgi:inward rectifier potassium channel
MAQNELRFPPVRAVGLARSPFSDLYHSILTCAWWIYFTGFVGIFLVVNAVFALLYLLAPGSIANATPGDFGDAFFFSVQTLATIGYGAMAPATTYGHIVVTSEALIGLLGLAIVTGITFAKFSRPTARVIFSDKAVLAPRNGVPHLMFRMGNARRNMLVEAQLRVGVLLEEVSAEGQVMRTPHEITLVRERTPLFSLSWTAMHKIDEKSPFFGDDWRERLAARKGELFLSLVGTDETFAAQIHAGKRYALADIVANAHFKDVLIIQEDGTRVIDYRNFHEVVPAKSA